MLLLSHAALPAVTFPPGAIPACSSSTSTFAFACSTSSLLLLLARARWLLYLLLLKLLVSVLYPLFTTRLPPSSVAAPRVISSLITTSLWLMLGAQVLSHLGVRGCPTVEDTRSRTACSLPLKAELMTRVPAEV